jgi:hypothetical protein
MVKKGNNMNTSTNIDTTIDAIKEVSSNALLKHGFSRSRQRLFDLSKTLDQAWQDYKVAHGKSYHKELVLFVIKKSTNGLRYHTIARRSGIQRLLVHDCLSELIREELIYKKLIGKNLLYCAKK